MHGIFIATWQGLANGWPPNFFLRNLDKKLEGGKIELLWFSTVAGCSDFPVIETTTASHEWRTGSWIIILKWSNDEWEEIHNNGRRKSCGTECSDDSLPCTVYPIRCDVYLEIRTFVSVVRFWIGFPVSRLVTVIFNVKLWVEVIKPCSTLLLST